MQLLPARARRRDDAGACQGPCPSPHPIRSSRPVLQRPGSGECYLMRGVPNDELLASDFERRAVESELSDACGQGRLSLEEFSERLDRANAARTRGELAVL